MNDERVQEAVTAFLVRLIRETGDGDEFQRVLLQTAGLMGAFYIEYARSERSYKRTKLGRGHRRLRHLLTEKGLDRLKGDPADTRRQEER